MDEAATKVRRWREDPVSFVRECFQVEPDDWQVELLRAFPHQKRLAAVACKGPGKTALMSWLGWNFLATRPQCKVPCTSITGDNLDDCLWAEFSKWQKKSPFLLRAFQWTQTRIFARGHPETWWASARKWKQDADAEQQANTLAGLHEDYLLFLIDEVSDIPDGVVSAAEASLAGGIETKLVIGGNCTRNEGPLYRAATTDRKLWYVVHITGDPDDPRRSPRIDIEEARRQIQKHGRNSYIVRVNILGQFPERQADKLLDMADCQAAMERTLRSEVFSWDAKRLGVDVARFGDDASSLAPRQGRMAFELAELRGLDTVALAEHVVRKAQQIDADAIFIDGTGIGAGVVDNCRARGFGHLVHEVHFGMRATEDERFENKRAEMYWQAAEWVRAEGCLPKDFLLAAELSSPKYWFDKRGRVCLEAKDDIKARLGRSPDRADSFVLTFASTVAPKLHRQQGAIGKALTEYDPFDRSRG